MNKRKAWFHGDISGTVRWNLKMRPHISQNQLQSPFPGSNKNDNCGYLSNAAPPRFGTVHQSGHHKPQSFCWNQNIALLQPWCKKLYKNQTYAGSQKWDRLAVPFLKPHARLSKRTKEKPFHGTIFGTVWRYHIWDRKIANSTAKADPVLNLYY